MMVQEQGAHLLKGPLDSGDLVDDVDAVLAVLHHPLYTEHVPLDGRQASNEVTRSVTRGFGLCHFASPSMPLCLLTHPPWGGIGRNLSEPVRGVNPPVDTRAVVCVLRTPERRSTRTGPAPPESIMSLESSIKTVLTLGKGLAVGLPPAAEDEDPIELFRTWFGAAREAGVLLHEAVALATASPDGFPSARMVL